MMKNKRNHKTKNKNKNKNKNKRNSNTKVKHNLSWNQRCMACLIPSILGMTIFFFLPYVRVLYYSVIDNQFLKNLVGLQNYIDTLSNPYFQLAMKNSLLIIAIGVPILIILAIVLSLLLSFHMKKMKRLRDAFIFPMFIPTAGIVLVWQQLFSSFQSAAPVYLLFIWKNIGICIILLTAALTTIDANVYEAARIDGAKTLFLHRKITIPMLTPTIFFTVMLAIVNSFKIFKESYLYYGNKYPPDHSYTLQFYMNNNFLKFNYQSLASSSILTSLLVLLIVGAGLLIQRRYQS